MKLLKNNLSNKMRIEGERRPVVRILSLEIKSRQTQELEYNRPAPCGCRLGLQLYVEKNKINNKTGTVKKGHI